MSYSISYSLLLNTLETHCFQTISKLCTIVL
uniref:Uncharacterized protein n=1 Tax=Siphoviridae sp. ctnot10 TaxID=2826458 RepID=A0A8S5NC62_9CAUD|nr:MAG TPA: hypothetical protein [Siphoviridae sp. ctnot10]